MHTFNKEKLRITDKLTKFLNDYIDRKYKFNIFKELKMENGSENRHSNLLRWLLDPKGSHKFGDKFFKDFFETLGIKTPDKLLNYKIKREKMSETGRPDIVITSDNFNCIIEVKFGAGETKEQCKHYYKDYGEEYKYIYLDLNDNSYEKLKYKNGYCEANFDFGNTYILATFDKNVIPVLNNILKEEKNKKKTEKNVSDIIEQYATLLEEKYEMYKGELIRDKIFDYQHPSKKNFKELQTIQEEIGEKLKYINTDRTVNHYFQNRRYEVMKILYYALKEKAQNDKNYRFRTEYNNKLSIDFEYRGQKICITNVKKDSEIKLKGKDFPLFNEDNYNEKLFYLTNNKEVKKNFIEVLENEIENFF